MDNDADRLTIDGPWDCVLRVHGALTLDGAERLGALRIIPAGAAEGGATELRGVLSGQAAVVGALVTLHALGLPLRSLTCTPRGEDGGGGGAAGTGAD